MKNYTSLLLICFMAYMISSGKSCQSVNPNALTNERIDLKFEGHTRHYLIHLPPEPFMMEEIPLVFVVHGGGGTAEGMTRFTDGKFNDLADRDGFIVIYPNGIDKHWNDGRENNSTAYKENINDVGFFKKIIEEVSSNYRIDQKRIFTCGISNGGFISNRLACDLSGTIRAAGIVTAQMAEVNYGSCNPESAVSILIMNGTEDPLVPYDGGEVQVLNKKRGKVISTDKFVEMWVENNNCDKNGKTVQLRDVDPTDGCTIQKTSYKSCNSDSKVILYKIEGGGHTWPGGKQYLGKKLIGNVCRDIDGFEEIWNFFKSLDE